MQSKMLLAGRKKTKQKEERKPKKCKALYPALYC